MSSVAAADTYITPEAYLASERKAKVKSEYIHGEIFAMSGASLAHTLITLDIATELNIQLRGSPCKVITMTCACGRARKVPILSRRCCFLWYTSI